MPPTVATTTGVGALVAVALSDGTCVAESGWEHATTSNAIKNNARIRQVKCFIMRMTVAPNPGGEDRIRTCGEFPHTRFPGVPVKPLRHLSNRSASMAERAGFEPAIPVTRDTGFRDRRFQPLSHLSMPRNSAFRKQPYRPSLCAYSLVYRGQDMRGFTQVAQRHSDAPPLSPCAHAPLPLPTSPAPSLS